VNALARDYTAVDQEPAAGHHDECDVSKTVGPIEKVNIVATG
jgi:hypothetical protein